MPTIEFEQKFRMRPRPHFNVDSEFADQLKDDKTYKVVIVELIPAEGAKN